MCILNIAFILKCLRNVIYYLDTVIHKFLGSILSSSMLELIKKYSYKYKSFLIAKRTLSSRKEEKKDKLIRAVINIFSKLSSETLIF